MSIGNDSGTWNPGTKIDHGSDLAGNQHVPGTIGDSGTYEAHLPWASVVDPLYQDCFEMGHHTSVAPGFVSPESGHGGF